MELNATRGMDVCSRLLCKGLTTGRPLSKEFIKVEKKNFGNLAEKFSRKDRLRADYSGHTHTHTHTHTVSRKAKQ
jgi:hypothetical protein